MAARIKLVEEPSLSARFPAERIAVVELRTTDGRVLTSPPTAARGDPETPLSDQEVARKFGGLTEHLSPMRSRAIEDGVMTLGPEASAASLGELLLAPLDR
jgi:2-methylcitrate dehydratase PrpD